MAWKNRLLVLQALVLTGILSGAPALAAPPPLAIYDADPLHPANRLFAEFFQRERIVKGQLQYVGGDYIDLLAWGRTTLWDEPERVKRIEGWLKRLPPPADPLRRVLLLRDLWAAHDFLVGLNIIRSGSLQVRLRRGRLVAGLAGALKDLSLTETQLASLSGNYSAAVRSGRYSPTPVNPGQSDTPRTSAYLPPGLLSDPDRWVEMDFFQPNLHEDLSGRFITLHTRAYRGRSYFRLFYRFPGGRAQLVSYLGLLDRVGVDWRQAAQDGFILLKRDAPQVPVGTEVALVQFLMTLDRSLKPRPTPIVESLRHRLYRNVDGSALPETNTGLGMQVTEFTLKRKRLLAGDAGGLVPEAMDERQFRIIFQRDDAPDWGSVGHKVLFQQCVDCHMSPQHNRVGVHSMPSIVHMGGFDAGAQLGVARPMDPLKSDTRGLRVAKWKSRHETYRRLLEAVGR